MIVGGEEEEPCDLYYCKMLPIALHWDECVEDQSIGIDTILCNKLNSYSLTLNTQDK